MNPAGTLQRQLSLSVESGTAMEQSTVNTNISGDGAALLHGQQNEERYVIVH
jgi:hypothetical protein